MLTAIDWTHVAIAVAAIVLREVMAKYSPPPPPPPPPPPAVPPAPMPPVDPQPLAPRVDVAQLLELLRQLLHATPPRAIP